MRRSASILLLVCFALLATGIVQHLHNLGHLRPAEEEGPALQMRQVASGYGAAAMRGFGGADADCELCAQFHAPLLPVSAVPLLILVGIFVAFLSERAPRPIGSHIPLRIDCRGPPVLA